MRDNTVQKVIVGAYNEQGGYRSAVIETTDDGVALLRQVADMVPTVHVTTRPDFENKLRLHLSEAATMDDGLDHTPGEAPGPVTVGNLRFETASAAWGYRNGQVAQAVEYARLCEMAAGYAWDPNGPEGYRWVTYIELPTGQISFRMREAWIAHRFAGDDPQPAYTGEWDSHTREQKRDRLLAYISTA